MGNKKTEKRKAERERAKKTSGRTRASESIRRRIKLFNKPRDPFTNQRKEKEMRVLAVFQEEPLTALPFSRGGKPRIHGENRLHSYVPRNIPAGIIRAPFPPQNCLCRWEPVLEGRKQPEEWQLKLYHNLCPAKLRREHA